MMTGSMDVTSAFDGGNIVCHAADTPEEIRLTIACDALSSFRQWFYFRVTGEPNVERIMRIENAGKCSYPSGWDGYRAAASYDRREWRRIATDYRDGVLTLRHTPAHESAYYAYFAPYSMERHADLVADAQLKPGVSLTTAGKTLDGQSIDLLSIGTPHEDKLRYWVIARQHPGETMAEWWMEGFLERMLDNDDATAQSLLEKVVFYVVPNMNPDGSRRGHLRTNAIGMNLNREWNKASAAKSPEVFYVRRAMEENGVDFALDVHGDEALPCVFIAGAEGVPRFSETDATRLKVYKDALLEASPDFQTEHGYPVNAPGSANLSLCTNYVAETFGCLAMTLEMPFKDNAKRPDETHGWSPTRCRELGAANVDAMHRVVGILR